MSTILSITKRLMSRNSKHADNLPSLKQILSKANKGKEPLAGAKDKRTLSKIMEELEG